MTNAATLNPNKVIKLMTIFNSHGAMRLIGGRVVKIESGQCEIECDFRPDLSQHHGYFHAGIISTLVDNAGGLAGMSVASEQSSILTVEFKLNLIAPADGERILARGEVIKAGRTLTITQGKVFSYKSGQEKLVAIMQQTLMTVAATE